jgi:glycosyltransferase involved in cell wall biosynthesis
MSATGHATPRVTVVISCRNRSDLLRDCLAGLSAQTLGLANFEVVLVDNRSTEDLSVVVDEAATAGLDIRMFRTERDGGPAPARGAESVEGDERLCRHGIGGPERLGEPRHH